MPAYISILQATSRRCTQSAAASRLLLLGRTPYQRCVKIRRPNSDGLPFLQTIAQVGKGG
ncbi:hypothetical protein TMEN_3678 [Trichophyton mentagrophytes]|nr:hypothetical protein TMEN_3678 [Trichophyton mentagrophytes]